MAQRFYPQYEITYPFILLSGSANDTYERMRFTHFISRRQYLARQARFHNAWRRFK